MGDSHIKSLCDIFANLIFIQNIIDQFTGRTCLCFDIIGLCIAWVADMVVNADRAFCSVKIFCRRSETLLVPGIQCNEQIVYFLFLTGMYDPVASFQKLKRITDFFQIDRWLNIRKFLLYVEIKSDTGADTVAVRPNMAGDRNGLCIL